MTESFAYMMLYGASAMLAMTASCYLLFRRANAIAPDVRSPRLLRRWTAVFFASMAMSHLWYLPIFGSTAAEDVLSANTVGAILDFLTLIPSALIVLLSMLQDRRRPVWPVFAMFAPFVVGLTVCWVSRNYAVLPVLYAYYLLLGISIIIYMVRATRQYGRWLRDNYADLEHKEVWQSFVVLAVILIVFGLYVFDSQVPAIRYVTQTNGILLVCYLLWRVETLSDLSVSVQESEQVGDGLSAPAETECDGLQQVSKDRIEALLQRHCVDTQLYLQHDLTLLQLAKAIGTNRTYLGTYFTQAGITYNTYINDLRIRHFVRLYREAVAGRQSVTAQQLAYDSGYHSYSTFALAFKQRMGLTATSWMRNTAAAQA